MATMGEVSCDIEVRAAEPSCPGCLSGMWKRLIIPSSPAVQISGSPGLPPREDNCPVPYRDVHEDRSAT